VLALRKDQVQAAVEGIITFVGELEDILVRFGLTPRQGAFLVKLFNHGFLLRLQITPRYNQILHFQTNTD
jgi:hypothetical protein